MRVKSGSRRRGRRPAQPEPDAGIAEDVATDAGQDQTAQDWSGIAVGSTVNVTPHTGLPYWGTVDAKTPDSAIVWVVSLAGDGRQMHGNRDGVSLLTAALQPEAVQSAVIRQGSLQPEPRQPASRQPATRWPL